jgi:hypothetical protein
MAKCILHYTYVICLPVVGLHSWMKDRINQIKMSYTAITAVIRNAISADNRTQRSGINAKCLLVERHEIDA